MITLDNNVKLLDKYVIPAGVYDFVINRNIIQLKKYLEQHPKLLFKIAQFNQQLKLANQYAADNKCLCAYTIPWVTTYANCYNMGQRRVCLTFTQQVNLYRYMIRYWYPSPEMSNTRFLSMVALGTLQELKLAKQYIGAGKDPCVVGNKEVIVGKNFSSNYQFVEYLDNHYIWL